MRTLPVVLSLLALGFPVHAQQLAQREPPGLPPSEVAQSWLQQDPGVQEALGGLGAATQTAGMLRVSPNEWTLSLSSQQRSYKTGADSDEWSAQIERQLRLPDKRSLDRQLATVEGKLAEARYGEAVHEAARALAELYTHWAGAVRARELMEEQLRFGEESLRAAKLRHRAGDASLLELNTVEADTAEIRGRLSEANSAQRKALAQLRIRFPGADVQPPGLAEPDTIAESEELWKARILDTSDPLRIAQTRLEQAELAAARARANRIPDPTVGMYTASEAYSDETIIGVKVSIPIPGRYRSYQHSLAASEVQMAQALRDQQQRIIEFEVAQAYADATGNFERWKLAEQSAARSGDNARLTQRAYSLGEVDLQALLMARRQAVDAADSALDARVMALQSWHRLLVDAHLVWGMEHD